MRRFGLVVMAVAVAAVTTVGTSPGGAGSVKRGLARGQLARVVPYVGLPGVGAGVGVAQAEVDGAVARASAGVADFGMLTMILGAAGSVAPVPTPDLPGPITAESEGTRDVERSPATETAGGVLPLPLPSLAGAPAAPADPAHEEAHASPEPEARARVRGPELAAADVFSLAGADSTAQATPALSASTVSLARLALGAGAVVLSDLVWSARQADGEPGVASFSIGSVTVAGQSLPVDSPADAAAAVAAANEALTPTGLRLEAPVVTADATGATVSSLVIQVRNPEATADLLGQVMEPAAPVLGGVLDSLLASAPDAAGARLVVNALLATTTGRGGGRLEVGGAAARLGVFEVADPFVIPPPPAPPAVPAFSPPAPASVPGPPPPAALPFVPAPLPAFSSPPPAPNAPPGAARTRSDVAAPGGSELAVVPLRAPRTPGGASAPVVMGGAFLALAVLAAGDRLRLRRMGAV